MKLTVQYIQKVAKRDHRIEEVEVCEEGIVAVWLHPQYTWCALDDNRTVNHYHTGRDDCERDDCSVLLDDIKMIERVSA